MKPAAQTSPVDRALDALASVVRSLARDPVERDDETRRRFVADCETWAKHLLLLTPPPAPLDGPARSPVADRDYAGLREFVTRERRAEAAWVRSTLDDMRGLLGRFVTGIKRALPDEAAGDVRARAAMERLRAAVAGDSVEALKREATAAMTTIEDVLERRRERQSEQLAELGDHMRDLQARLVTAERESTEDPLTGLANRRAFDERAAEAAELDRFFSERSVVLFLDVDHFKEVNDRYGHRGGDAALARLGRLLAVTVPRRADCVARFGGEEFTVLLRATDRVAARRVVQRILDGVRAMQVDIDGTRFGITVSIGLAEIVHLETVERWIERADRAMYAAKTAGRDRIVEAGE